MAALDELACVTALFVSDTPSIFASFFGFNVLNLMFVVLLTSLGTWEFPQMVQKFHATKNEDAIKKETIISTIFALVVILVLSTPMSILPALVIASSSTLTIDFLKDNFINNLNERKQVLLMRILILIFVVISSVLALIRYKSSPAHGCVMGYFSGGVSGSLHVLPVREVGYQITLLGKISLCFRYHDIEYFFKVFPCHHTVAHQLRRDCHAGRLHHCACGERVHSPKGRIKN